MSHSRFEWANQTKATEREYQSVRIALDWLLEAPPDEIHGLTEAREWSDLAVSDAYAADRHLDATYLIRMFSVFERAVFSFWRLLPDNEKREVDGKLLIDEVGAERVMQVDFIEQAQAVRVHRNNLVHKRIDQHHAKMAFAEARARLLIFLDKLPKDWD